MKCPHDNKVICSYLEPGSAIEHECYDCIHYDPQPLKAHDPLRGRSPVGCLIVVMTLVIGFLAFAAWIINLIREPLL
jgi:hypothetical protein